MTESEFLNKCRKWAEKTYTDQFKKQLTKEEIRLLSAVGLGVWNNPKALHPTRGSYQDTYESELYTQAYNDIFTQYTSSEGIYQHIETSVYRKGHISATLEYNPTSHNRNLPLICIMLLSSIVALSNLAEETPWISQLCCISAIIIMSYCCIAKQLEIKWRTKQAIIIALWSQEMQNFIESPAFISYVCYKYLTDKHTEEELEKLKKFLCLNETWYTLAPIS